MKKVHKEKSLIILTTTLFLVILVLADIYLLTLVVKNGIPCTLGMGLIVIISVAIIVSYSYAPMAVSLSETSLVLYRGIGKKNFNYSDIDIIDIHISDEPAIRIFRIGGVSGFVGRYYTKKSDTIFPM